MTIDEWLELPGASARAIEFQVLGSRNWTGKAWKGEPFDPRRQEARPETSSRKTSATEWDDWKPIRDLD
jgi:hypothetical protein